MQFHRDGFRPGDPEAPTAPPPGPLPDEVDVLVVGSGPAGLVVAAQLAAFDGIVTRVVERRDGPLLLGQADGVACRTVEMFDAFGLSERLVREGYHVNETAFWRPDPADPSRIVRGGRIQDVEDGLSEFPHLILNQARVQDLLLDAMRRGPARIEPDHGCGVAGLTVGTGSHPVRVELSDGRVVHARYAVGCDGARSVVRPAIGGVMEGDSTNQAWGVMDVLAVTDFPDWRLKCVIRDADGSAMILIPREGGILGRLYVELGTAAQAAGTGLDDVVAAARRILSPYTLDVRETAWWSVYTVGQRVCDRFADSPDDPRVFVAGDACHTHSAKAGQGMNVSMQDGFNLGWKLGAVLRGRARPELLRTYATERRAVAQELIAFDEEWNRVLEGDGERFQQLFAAQGRYTAGVATRYHEPSVVRGHDAHQHLATGFGIGMRFHSAPVVRLADALPTQLGHAARADGRWRLYLFAAGDLSAAGDLAAVCTRLGPVLGRFTPAGADADAVIDLRAVLQRPHREVDWTALPALLRPATGRLGLADYEKVFCPDPRRGDVFDLRGVDRDRGALVLVRPDQYVAHVLPPDAHRELETFLAGVLVYPTGTKSAES